MIAKRLSVTQILPYVGAPILCAALLILRAGKADVFSLLFGELAIAFSYSASVSDLRKKLIPNTIILAMLASWAIVIMPQLFFDTDAALATALDSALGFALGGGLFMAIYLISRKGLGGGDVKLMAAAGLYLGYNGVLSSMFCGTLLAAVTVAVLMMMGKLGRKDTIPLAPFLCAGIIVTVFFQ